MNLDNMSKNKTSILINEVICIIGGERGISLLNIFIFLITRNGDEGMLVGKILH